MRMRTRRLFAKALSLVGAAAVLLAAGAAPRASGTTLARMTLTQMARAANLVVRARCTSTTGQWQQGSIATVSTFAVLERFKGAAPAQVEVRLPGGRVGHLVMNVEGAPRFQPGEEGVLFLKKTTAGDYSVTGWAEGTFRIRASSGAEQPRVTQDSSSLPVFDTATHTFKNEGVRNLPLDQFRQRLAAALAEAAAGGMR